MSKLEVLHQQIVLCEQCDLCRQGRSQVVPGEGPEDALIAFFGEGPGQHEDEQGRPFVGRAGQFLRSTLQSNRIPWKDVYISNTVRCRPPDNRDPLPEEAEACWQWTLQTLKVIEPRIIVTLGKPALMTMARKLGFSKKVGQATITKLAGKPIFVEERNFYCFPMLHPAYALRRMDARESFSAHMKYLKVAIPGWLERPS
ncbi:unnamed protein product [marine sediment metagenome]|uniref:Type-4 uracil-DNA glycosylase n=1 Tax=marine sediment metagenome TaxID=412755 RepID=X0RN59_9ZZZZ